MTKFFVEKVKCSLILSFCLLMPPFKAHCQEAYDTTKTSETAFCGFFIEPYGGVFWGLNDTTDLTTKNTYDIQLLKASFKNSSPKRLLAFTGTGGLKLGLWMEKEKYPAWLKHFGFFFDASYQYFNYHHTLKNTKIRYLDCSVDPNLGPAFAKTTTKLKSKGPTALVSLMFAGRLGFFKTQNAPFGWFQPYLAIGPAVFFAKQKSALTVFPHETENQNQLYLNIANKRSMSTGHFDKKVFPALALDFGFDFRVFKHVSLDYFFKYYYVVPHFSYSAYRWTQKETCHLLSNQFGIAWHF